MQDREKDLGIISDPRLRSEIARFLVERFYGDIGLDEPENIANFGLLNEHLKIGSALVIFNQISNDNAPIVIASTIAKCSQSIRVVSGVASYKDLDFRRYPYQATLITVLSSLSGFKPFPVVQDYDQVSYSLEKKKDLLRELRERGKEILGQPGGVLFISPEGTRSLDGTLQRAKGGIRRLSTYGDVHILPVAFIPQGEYSRDLNVFSQGRFVMKTGELFTIEEVVEEGIPKGLNSADGAMLKLGELLPSRMRGFYAPYY